MVALYSGENTLCVKCGHGEADTEYADDAIGIPALWRTCKRCRYKWWELPLDAEAEDDELE